MKKRIISLILATLLLCSITVCASADSTVNEARKGVAKILELVSVDGELVFELSSTGTGFFVGEKDSPVTYLVTNYHVISDYVNYGEGEVVRIKNDYGTSVDLQVQLQVCFDSETMLEAYVLDYDETQDLAILKLESPSEARVALPLRIPTEEMVGDTMYVVGYPGSNEALDTTSVWGVEDSIVAKGTIGRLVTESNTGDKWIGSSDIDVHHGNSGGPILDEQGAVIGVACMTISDGQDDMNYAVNGEAVIEMLRRNEVPFVNADEVVVEAESTPVPDEDSGSSSTLIIVGAVAAIAVVAVLVLSSKAKKSKKTANEPEEINKTSHAQAQVVEKKLNPVVRSLSPQHKKQKVAIKSAPIIIGRAKDCDIVFKEGTPGVSGKHCAITWDENNKVFVLKDMDSTYGTFLDSGMKLDSNRVYRLKAGDSFYLGDKENTLCVELD